MYVDAKQEEKSLLIQKSKLAFRWSCWLISVVTVMNRSAFFVSLSGFEHEKSMG